MSFNAAADRVVARREGDSARPAGVVPVMVRLEGLTSRDGFAMWLELELPVRLHDSPVDRQAFAERFLKHGAIGTAAHVGEYLRAALALPALSVVGEWSAQELVENGARADVSGLLEQAAAKPLFAVGLQVQGEVAVRVGCPDWERRRVEVAAEAARVAAAEREGELLRRFEDIRRQSPDVPAGALLMGLPAGERFEALRALLKAAGTRVSSRLFIVAGDALFEVDITADRVLPLGLSTELGPLRSVDAIQRKGRAALLIGARDGVFLADPDDPGAAEVFEADVDQSPFGFSHLAYDESLDVIHATHADVGMMSWQTGLGTRSVRAKGEFEGGPPRQVEARDGLVHVAAGGTLFRAETHGPLRRVAAGDSPITQLVGNERELVIVRQSGGVETLLRRDGSIHAGTGRLRTPAGPGAALPWLGDMRLVIADEQGNGLSVIGAHDDVTTLLDGQRGPYAALAASAGVVVAVAADRQRLVCWRPWEQPPFADLHVISRTRSRVADVAVV